MKKIVKNGLASLLFAVSLLTGGIAVVGATPAIVNAECSSSLGDDPLQNGVDCAKPNGVTGNLFEEDGLFSQVTTLLIFLVGIIAVVMLIIGGIRYALSGGDQSAVTSAKNTILYAIIGLVVAFLAYGIVSYVTAQLRKGSESDGASLVLPLNQKQS